MTQTVCIAYILNIRRMCCIVNTIFENRYKVGLITHLPERFLVVAEIARAAVSKAGVLQPEGGVLVYRK